MPAVALLLEKAREEAEQAWRNVAVRRLLVSARRGREPPAMVRMVR